MNGTIEIGKIMRQAHEQTEVIKRFKARQVVDQEKIHHNRKIDGQIKGVLQRCQEHQLTHKEASDRIHVLESQIR